MIHRPVDVFKGLRDVDPFNDEGYIELVRDVTTGKYKMSKPRTSRVWSNQSYLETSISGVPFTNVTNSNGPVTFTDSSAVVFEDGSWEFVLKLQWLTNRGGVVRMNAPLETRNSLIGGTSTNSSDTITETFDLLAGDQVDVIFLKNGNTSNNQGTTIRSWSLEVNQLK